MVSLIQNAAGMIVLYHAYRALRSTWLWLAHSEHAGLDRLIALFDRLAARWQASERARLDMQPCGTVFRSCGVINRINPVYLRDLGDGLLLSVRRTRNQYALLAVYASLNKAALISLHDDLASAVEACQVANITKG